MGSRDGFIVKDSGVRESFDSGMVRDTEDGKSQYTRMLEGPMFYRWAEHLTKGAKKYPDNADGTANWTHANSETELRRFQRSAFRHFIQWLRGDRDEDHAAAIFFNVNCAEYVRDRLALEKPKSVEKPSWCQGEGCDGSHESIGDHVMWLWDRTSRE